MTEESSTDEPVFAVTEEPDSGRFLLTRDGELVGYANYSASDKNVVVPHVETLREYRGNGYGDRLMDGLLALLRAQGRTITPTCSFAAGHIRDNPEQADLLA